MNWTRVGLGSAGLAVACCLLLTGKPLLVKAAEAPVRKDLFLLRPENSPFYQAPQNKVAPGDTPLPDGAGRDTTKKICGGCHSTNVWAGQRHSTEKWSSIIDNMLTKGLVASDDDLATVNDYLGKYLAPPASDAAPHAPPQ